MVERIADMVNSVGLVNWILLTALLIMPVTARPGKCGKGIVSVPWMHGAAYIDSRPRPCSRG